MSSYTVTHAACGQKHEPFTPCPEPSEQRAAAIQKAHAAIACLRGAVHELEAGDEEMATFQLDKAGTKVYGALLALDRLDVIDDRPRWVRWLFGGGS
jgi:hypothetical protein